MMVASLDPVGKTVSLVSVPRDLIDTPLGDGDVFGPKLNSLLGYADAHHDQFPKGGMRTLEDAIGALLHPHPLLREDRLRRLHRHGRRRRRGRRHRGQGLRGPRLRRLRVREARLVDHRRATPPRRAERAGLRAVAQGRGRERLHPGRPPAADPVALRDKVTSGGNLLFQLPDLLDAVGRTIRSDVPVDKLPALAAIMEEISHRNVVSTVIRYPLVHPKSTRYGDSQEPDLAAIRAVAAGFFSPPGTPPTAGRRRSRPGRARFQPGRRTRPAGGRGWAIRPRAASSSGPMEPPSARTGRAALPGGRRPAGDDGVRAR